LGLTFASDQLPSLSMYCLTADGQFVLILRAYLPKTALIERRYIPPAVQAARLRSRPSSEGS